MEKLISIIIPLYNSEATISRCLDSILKQDYENYEIILINDGSTDNTEEIVKLYLDSNFNKINYYFQKNSGPGSARNVGLNAAKGDFVLFIDSDDYIDNGYFNTVNNIFEKTNDLNVIQFGYKRLSSSMTVLEESVADSAKTINRSHVIVKHYGLTEEIDMFLCSKAFRKSSLDKIKFKKYYYAEDQLFLTEYFYHQEKILIYPESFYNYIMSEDSLVRTPFSKLKLDGIKAAQDMYDLHCYFYPKNSFMASNKLCFFISTMYIYSNKGGYSKKVLKSKFNKHYKLLTEMSERSFKLEKKFKMFYKLFYYMPNLTSFLYNLLFTLKVGRL